MLTLMLLRHGKAEELAAGLIDRDRDLTPRGRRASQAIGRHLAANALIPELVLCSPARRATETWRLAALELPKPPPVIVDDAIYAFDDGETMLSSLSQRAGAATSVLIVGHNPSIETLACRLANNGTKKLRAHLAAKYPTGTLAVLALDSNDWSAIGGGTLTHFVRPKDILSGG